MSDTDPFMMFHSPSNDNASLDPGKSYIARILQEWRDLEEAAAGIWDDSPNETPSE